MKYLTLFEVLSHMSYFDEEKLKKAVYQDEPIESKKYTELKAYLYDLLLKCLQSFDEVNSVDARLNQLLQSVAVLYKRGFYDGCREQLQKARRLALQYEYFSIQLDVIRWEKQLAYTQMDVDFLHKNIEKLEFEENEALEKIARIAAYRSAFFQVYTTTKQEAQQRNLDRVAYLRSLLRPELFDSPETANSHRARILYYRTLNIYHYAAVDYERFYESGKILVALMESQPHLLRELLADYIAALSNMILSCGMLRKYEEVRECLQKLRDLSPNSVDDRMKIHRQYFTNLFSLCTYTGAFEEARREMQRCQEEAEALDIHGYETASFYYQYFLISFGCEDFNVALDYLNDWLNQPKSVQREDLQSLARILALITHFELGNTILVDSLLRATARFLKKKDRLYALEKRFIRCMNELLRCATQAEQRKVFEKLKKDIQGQASTRAMLQLFDVEAWVASKISGNRFAEEIRKKWA